MHNVSEFIDTAKRSDLEHLLLRIEEKLGKKHPSKLHISRETFTIADNKKCLSLEQLFLVTNTFSSWYNSANSSQQKMSRVRVWLTFLLIRYGGLRLGEVLSLHEEQSIDSINSCLIIQGKYARRVVLPKVVIDEITTFFESSMYYSLKGRVFSLDQGYIRRKFYELAEASGLSKDLVNPTTLRISRAVELLQGGVPPRVVQAFLGEQSLNFITGYLALEDETIQHIICEFIQKETKMSTSARNKFSGKITGIKKDGLLVEVEVTTPANLKVVSVITEESFTTLGLSEGSVVTATIKAPWVIIDEQNTSKTSARNCFSGKVSNVKASQIASEVLVTLEEGSTVCALVTSESVSALALKEGMPVNVLFKAFAVVLNIVQ